MAELQFPDPALACELMALRPWRQADLASMVALFSDPLVQRFSWPRSDEYTRADGAAYLAGQEQARQAGSALHFAFVAPDDANVLLGGGSLYDVDTQEQRAATGYWLGPDARGRGIATAALRLMAQWAFDDLGLQRIELTCGPDNLASQAVARRCGFVSEGVLRSHMNHKGNRRDTVLYSLLPTELT
jgi:RimJ/RimL family protein N-acetyltransferase